MDAGCPEGTDGPILVDIPPILQFRHWLPGHRAALPTDILRPPLNGHSGQQTKNVAASTR
jgi:hypothetical protein